MRLTELAEAATGSLEDRLESLPSLMIVSFSAILIAWWCGFFRTTPTSKPSDKYQVHLVEVLTVFALFIVSSLVILPLLTVIVLFFFYGTVDINFQYSPLLQGSFNLSSIFVSAIVVIGYSYYLMKQKQRTVWGEHASEKKARNFALGALTWFIGFPLANIAGQLMAIILLLVYPKANLQTDQSAVAYLKMTTAFPLLLTLTMISLIFIVPIVEELLFRGFLQAWLRNRLKRWQAIAITSLVFAGFHFATSQGWANVELLPALFVLSCFLGFLYERQQSLWASIGLHATFNAVSIALILYSL